MAEELQYSTKRKYEDPTATAPTSATTRRQTGFSAPISSISPQDSNPNSYNNVPPPVDDITLAKQKAQEIAARLFNTASNAEAKRPRVENGDDSNDYQQKAQAIPSLPIPYGFQGSTGGGYQSSGGGYQGGGGGYQGSSKKIDIPNERVGVIIGKSGETIKYLQIQSGAKIQVTRDMDADPNSRNRAVELMGTSEQISKAEQLIKDVLAEAESGSSGMAPKRFVPTPGAEQFSMKVPSNKVGLIIGKGGETIKNMQARSGARIQLIPLHPPPGDTSTERTVYIDGNQQQIEVAKQLVNEVISENRLRNSSMGGGYPQQNFRPQTQNWGQPGPAVQQPGYGYMQPGAYPGAPPQYNMPQPPYTGYPPQSASTGWDQTAAPQTQQSTPGSGYDYYNQPPPQQPAAGGSTTPTADNTGGYNYSQPPVSSYNQPQAPYGGSSYSQQPPAQQQGYSQDGYGSYPPAPQGGYGQQQTSVQPGYDQSQGYNSGPGYGTGSNPAQDGAYGSQGASTQVVPPVQPPIVNQQGYGSQQPTTPTNYPAQGSQPGYPPQTGYGTQLSAQPVSAPPTQASYGPPPVQNPPSQGIYGHAQPTSSQAGYAQPASVQPAYAHSQSTPTHTAPATSDHRPPATGLAPGATQAGYVQQPYSVPSTAQPGYGAQQQAYGDSYAAGYSKPPVYSGESTVSNNAHGTYDAAPGSQPNQQGGVAKTSPPS